MMATKVVSHRESEEDIRKLEELDIRATDFAREAWALHMQRIRAKEALEWFRKHPMPLDRPAEQIIREMRDER